MAIASRRSRCNFFSLVSLVCLVRTYGFAPITNGKSTISGLDVTKLSASSSSLDGKPLSGAVCLVTGASRGIGKGIALELGKQGATVYVTGTTSTKSSAKGRFVADEESGGPGTIEDTAEEITRAGGKGIGVLCNHAVDDDVRACMDQIQQEHGRLDILVNNCFRLPRGGVQQLYKPFWDQGPEIWDTIHTVGLRSHFVATSLAMPLLRAAQQSPHRAVPRPFIGMVSSFGGLTYTFNVPYGVGKAGVDRLAKDMAIELTPENICVVSFWPGLVDTERTQESVKNGDWEKYVQLPLDKAETPAFTGKAVVATAMDSENMKKSGTPQIVAELAQEYDFYDINGKRPPSIRSMKFLIPTYGMDGDTRARVPEWLIPDWKLPLWIMSQGQPPSKE